MCHYEPDNDYYEVRLKSQNMRMAGLCAKEENWTLLGVLIPILTSIAANERQELYKAVCKKDIQERIVQLLHLYHFKALSKILQEATLRNLQWRKLAW